MNHPLYGFVHSEAETRPKNEHSLIQFIAPNRFFHDARTALSIALSLPTTSSKGSTPDTLKDWLDIETRAWPDLVGRLAAHQSLVQELQALEAETAEVDNSLKSAFGALSDRSATLSRLIAEAQALIPSESQSALRCFPWRRMLAHI